VGFGGRCRFGDEIDDIHAAYKLPTHSAEPSLIGVPQQWPQRYQQQLAEAV